MEGVLCVVMVGTESDQPKDHAMKSVTKWTLLSCGLIGVLLAANGGCERDHRRERREQERVEEHHPEHRVEVIVR